MEKAGLWRLFWVEGEFRTILRQAELDFVKRLIADIESGSLEGVEWWTEVHGPNGENVTLPTFFEQI